MDAYDLVDQAIANGKAWHVGSEPGRSQYIFTTEAEAVAMVAHLNAISRSGYNAVRTQAEINAHHEALRDHRGVA